MRCVSDRVRLAHSETLVGARVKHSFKATRVATRPALTVTELMERQPFPR